MTSEIPDFMSNPALLKRIEELRGMDEFPLPKGPALALIRLTQREGTSLAVVAHALKADPTLSVRVIRVANGVGSAEHGPVVSLRDAANVLGVPAVRSLAMGFSLMENYRSGQCRNFDYARFWSRSLARAVALQLLAAGGQGCPVPDAFSVGLLAGVGELVLATLFPTPYAELLQHPDGKAGLPQREQEAFAVTHAVLTASLLLDYNLPEFCASAVESPEPVPGQQQAPAVAAAQQMLALADHIGAICVAAPTEWQALMPRLFDLGLQLSLGADALVGLCDRAAHEWREWGAQLELETGPMPRFEQRAAAPAIDVLPGVPPRLVPDPSPDAQPVSGPSVLPVTAPGPGAAEAGSQPMCILVVGDEARVRKPVCGLLSDAGQRAVEAANGRQGLAMAIELQPQIMLVDLLATEVDGLELIRTLRQFKAGRCIYVMLLAARADDENLVAAFAAGADACLTLPLEPRVLAAHLLAGRRMAGLQEEFEREHEAVRRISAELAVSNRQLQEIGMTDLLTGCPNRRHAMDRMQQEWAVALRSQRPLACMVIDIDNLKQINEVHGHDAGDNVLKLVASAFKGEMRAQDVLARSGGDEFLVICPDTTLEAALACAERIRISVETLPIVGGAQPLRGSVSIGVAVRDATMAGPDTLIRLADEGAYLAKRRRNAVVTVQSSATLSLRTA